MQLAGPSWFCRDVRWFASVSQLVVLAIGIGASSVAAAANPSACGFSSSEAAVTLSQGGVPLAMRAEPLPLERQQRLLHRRQRLLHREPSEAIQCGKTQLYLRSILDRLLRVAGLVPWVGLEPPLELVLQCDDRVPLPVARALAGNVLMVPRALPLLARSEDALVAVLAHEVAHFSLRHFERLYQTLSAEGPARGRDIKVAHEREADITGLRLLTSAGYDPRAAIDHLRAVSLLPGAGTPPSRPAQHDAVSARAAQLRAQIEDCGYSFSGRRTPIPAEVLAELERSQDLVTQAKAPSPAATGTLVSGAPPRP